MTALGRHRENATGREIKKANDLTWGGERPSVIIRKYANRRLYDANQSRYVTLDGLARMVADGACAHVLAAGSGTDLTRQMLAQIFFEGENRDGLLDESVLTRLIRLRRHPERGVLSRHITQALDTFPRQKTTGGEVLAFTGGPDEGLARA
jgi:polyhydroxyalkanoate synthesis repressor PhaR